MARWRTRLYKTDRARDFDHERDRQVRARQVYETIDRQRYQWIVVFVAGIGFFLDGYTLFASNIAFPMISYVYWTDSDSHGKLMWINIATLAGTMLGQVFFGVLADQKGRKRMYGVELVMLIAATFGVVMASTGTHDSMSIFGWLMTWRFFTGIGVGGDYPLSAIITSEFAPTSQRGRMLASTFLMQPLGQTASNLASMAVVAITRRVLGSADYTRAADIMWRWIIGIGVFPGMLAILFRLAIPETPRFLLEIEEDPLRAQSEAGDLFGDAGDEEELVSPISVDVERNTWMLDTKGTSTLHRPATSFSMDGHGVYYNDGFVMDERHQSVLTNADWTFRAPQSTNLNSSWPEIRADVYQYFIKEKNYRTLLAAGASWFLLDMSFYGIGLSSPHFLATTWGSLHIHDRAPPWQVTNNPNATIYDTFILTSVHALVILNLGSLLGSALLIMVINRVDRVALQKYGFLFLASLFVAMGVIFMSSGNRREGPLAVSLYFVAQLAFNLGPNATTYILAAEVFPTRYRATCNGISAAMGKLGALSMQLIATLIANARHQHWEKLLASGVKPDGSHRPQLYGTMLIGFSATMVLGFFVSMWLPRVQEHVVERRPSDSSSKRLNKIEGTDKRNKKSTGVLAQVKRRLSGGSPLVSRNLRSKTLEELSLGRQGEQSRSASSNGWY